MRKIIELKNITKSFDGEVVLDNISLDIYDNEFMTLLGPSGCGKTTTLRIIAGFEQPDQGEVYFLGEDIAALPPHKRNVNTVFQRYALFPHLNVFENIAFPLREKKVGYLYPRTISYSFLCGRPMVAPTFSNAPSPLSVGAATRRP